MKIVQKTNHFEQWFLGLRDRTTRLRIQARIDRVTDGNFGDHKSVGENVFEMRLQFGAGYRIYYLERNSDIVVLLAGGDKSTQSSDIQTAIAMARHLGVVP
jgi:putative addiction module killer protein